MNKTKVISILERYNFKPLKSKGQNFLVDEGLAKRITGLLSEDQNKVIEVGPGLGSLTIFLSQKPFELTVVEIDRGYATYLKEEYKETEVEHADFLKYRIGDEKTSFISNIPYNITTKIIEKVLIETKNLYEFVFMVQKDVDQRLFATPSSKEYGPIAILIALLGELHFLFDVSPDKFYPQPHVQSAVYKFTTNKEMLNQKDFYQFLKIAFRQRRKTLVNNLSGKVDIKKLLVFLNDKELPENIRAEALTPQELRMLYEMLTKKS